MTEFTPLLNQENDVSRYNAPSTTEDDLETSVHEAECEIPLLEIVKALFLEWRKNGANEELTSQDIMAMHLEYRRVTRGRQVFHTQHVIMNELADAMLKWTRIAKAFIGHPDTFVLRHNILRNLRQNWQSITEYDEDLARNLNAYEPPTYRERIQYGWINCLRKYEEMQKFFSRFTFQLLIFIILIGWPLSLFIMGVKFLSLCSMNTFLPYTMVAIGLLGIAVFLLRLVLAIVENWYWYNMQTELPYLWISLSVLELLFLVIFIIQQCFFVGNSPSIESKAPNFCNETFYSFTFWMKRISTVFAVVWLATYFVKAVFWVMRFRYHYRSPFELN